MSRPLPHHRRAFPAALLACLALCVLAIAGCERPASRDLQPGSYRATVQLPGDKTVPFGLDVAREERGFVLYLVNGEERVRVDRVTFAKGRLTASLPGRGSTLEAEVDGDRLSGEIRLRQDGERALHMPFAAQYGATWRFYEQPRSDNADVAGRWAVTFTDPQGESAQGVMELGQLADDVTGRTLLPSVEERHLAGEVYDGELRLSRFDGTTAVLYEARLDAQGRLAGEAWSDGAGRRSFVAVRNPDASVGGFVDAPVPEDQPPVTVPQAVFTREN
jgi:hypothetical protein